MFFLVKCPICSIEIPFDNFDRFVSNLISHGTLATMVKQYLREENTSQICNSCQNNSINNLNENICQKCVKDNENIKKKILETMNNCEDLLANQTILFPEKIQEEVKQLYEIIEQRTIEFHEKIDKYQAELENFLTTQEQTNEMNA